MKSKHISISRLMDFMRCPAAYLENVRRAREGEVVVTEGVVLGDVTHMLTAGEKPEAAQQFIEAKLPAATAEKKSEVLEQAAQRATRATDMSAPEVTNKRREVQLMWQDPETGYHIYAKPDELFYFEEERKGRRIEVMQITDVKSQAEAVKSYHWRQVYLFALVAAFALRYSHAIKLVVRLANPGTEETRWFSSAETWRQLHKLRATLRDLDQAWETRKFEHRAGGYCRGCPLLESCREGQFELARREHMQLTRMAEEDDAVNDNGFGRRPLPVMHYEERVA